MHDEPSTYVVGLREHSTSADMVLKTFNECTIKVSKTSDTTMIFFQKFQKLKLVSN